MASHRLDRQETRLALGESTRLVHNKGIDLLHYLERFRILDEDARERPPPRCDHNGHRGRQPQRARTGDDQHGHRVDQGIRHPRLRTHETPGHEGEDSGHHHGRNKIGRHLISEPLDRCPASLGLAHHLDNLGQQRLAPNPFRPHDKAPRAVDRAARNTAAGSFLDGDGLACHHRLVYQAMAF